MSIDQPKRARSEPIRRVLTSVADTVRRASAPVRRLSASIVENISQLKRDHNTSVTIIASVYNNGCGVGIVTAPWAIAKGKVNIHFHNF